MKTLAPAAWPVVRLAQIAQVQMGVAKNGEKKLKRPVELPYLRVANVQDGHVDLRKIKTIEVEAADVSRYRLEAGDVLMTEGGDFDKLGRGTVWNGEISPCLHQNHVFAVRVDRSALLPEFLAAYCAAEPGRRYFLGCSKQTTNLASINSTQLKELSIPVPPVAEQRCIVAVLDRCDEAITLAEKALFGTQGTLKRVVHRWVFSGVRNPSAFNLMCSKELATNGWRCFEIAEFAEEISRVNREGTALPVLSSTKLKGIVLASQYFGKQVHSSDTTTYKRVCRGEFVYATNHVEEGSIGLQDVCEEGLVSPMYTAFGVDSKIVDANFLFALLKTETYRQIFEANTSASVNRRGSLRWKDFSRLPVYLPSLEVQQEIVARIATIRRLVGLQERRVDLLRQRKRGLMQKLLTGQWRLASDATGDLSDREMAHA